jgi:hypothetical protein
MRVCGREKGAAPWRHAKLFSLALGLSAARCLAGSRARAGERPGTAETGERPTPDQPFERLIEGNARCMSGVARRHAFRPSAKL